MFLGELSCLAVFYILLCHDRRSPEPSMNPGQSFNPLLFFPPAMCDMTATSIMYVGEYVVSALYADKGLVTAGCGVPNISRPLVCGCSSQHDQRLQFPDAAWGCHHLHRPVLSRLPGPAPGAQSMGGHLHHHPRAGHRGTRRPLQRAR